VSPSFPISRDPPEGGTLEGAEVEYEDSNLFPISRDPPEGGTRSHLLVCVVQYEFPISRDPPEGGTSRRGLR